MNKDIDINNFEYVIVGDTKEYEGCLIYCCNNSKIIAEKRLEEILANKKYTNEFKNIRIEIVSKKDCWWNDKSNF